MKTEFIPYTEALALKELGFDEPCFGQFYKHPTQKEEEFRLFHDCVWEDRTTSYWRTNISNHFVSAPTFSQVFRWFREKYNLHAEITWSPSYEYEPGKWSDAIYEITFVDVSYTKEWKAESPDMQRGEGKQLTYEEAELECLKALIEIVKEK
jgi:hypothetical protein